MRSESWHILRTRTGFEVGTAMSINAPAYVPRRRISVFNRRHRRMTHRVVPAFPGYLFVQSEAPQTVHLPSRDVFGFMRNADRTFSVLQSRHFEELVAFERDVLMAFPVPSACPQRIRHGDQITFEQGHVLEGLDAVLEGVKDGKSIVRLLTSGHLVEVSPSAFLAA